ncbi:MAG: mechanosensitive ion channel domain-containing protein, partial [Pseudomonadota bacterium]
TVIETFDRAALIVPNSELVSSTVINWTHQNLNGRIIVGVKVAMGTDPRQVERLMLEVARAHPMVLRRPAPFVLFRGYTEYAMSFEVRAVLRDVNWILNVQSDFYFEIHRRFAEEGVEIPVQRSEIALDAGALAGRAAPPGPSGPPAPLQPATEVPALTPGSLSGGARLSGTAPAGMESGDAGDAGTGDAR